MKYQCFRVFKFALLTGLIISIACADYISYELYSVFYPETSVRPKDHDKYFFTYYYPYGEESYSYEATSHDTVLNANAWYEYFGKKILNYQIKLELHKNDNLTDDFIKKVKSLGKQNALNYLLSLKEIDNLIVDNRESYWDERKPIDTLKVKKFISEIEGIFLNEKDDFLKERYLYLLIKSSASIKDYKNVIALFEKYNTVVKVKSYVSEWSQSYFAGAFYHIGNHPRSYYEFSKVFAHCPSRKAVANLSVKTYSIPFTDDVLKFCKSDEEIANVYAIYGLQSFSDIILAIENIMQINPNHEMLQLLISRAINQQEHYFYNAKNYDYYFGDSDDKKDEQKIIADSKIQLKRLESLITKIRLNVSTQNVDFYHLATAYLKLLANDPRAAEISLAMVKNTANDRYITKQQKTLQIVQSLLSVVPYDNESFGPVLDDFQYLLNEMTSARDVSVIKYLSQKLVQYYEAKEISIIEPKKSFWQGCSKQKEIKPSAILLARTFYAKSLSVISQTWEKPGTILKIGGYEMQPYLDTMSLNILESAIRFFENKNITTLDKKLVKLSYKSNNQLYLEYGRKLMLHHDFDQAAIAFDAIDKKYLDSILQLTEVLILPKLKLKSEKVISLKDPVRYIKDIAKLKEKATNNPNDALTNYQYALALINISYHGNAWLLSNSYKSVSEPHIIDWISNKKRFTLDRELMNDYYGLDKAFVHINKGLNYCTDTELCAKIIYLAALFEDTSEWLKLEIDEPIDRDEKKSYYDKIIEKQDLDENIYFNKLKTKYAQTEYTKMIIQECDDFAKYVKY